MRFPMTLLSPSCAMPSPSDFHQDVTDTILTSLREGRASWQKPWDATLRMPLYPQVAFSKEYVCVPTDCDVLPPRYMFTSELATNPQVVVYPCSVKVTDEVPFPVPTAWKESPL